MSNVAGTDTSVFVGSFCRDWSEIMMRDPDSVPMYQATGGGQSLLSNRLSYFFNLRGPSISIDTACSASLVALHLACQSLKSGESKQAIVGGANVILSHELMISMSMMRLVWPNVPRRTHTYAIADFFPLMDDPTHTILVPTVTPGVKERHVSSLNRWQTHFATATQSEP
jgi:3-oxoacyl-(acyl-carrier-protein) synthase